MPGTQHTQGKKTQQQYIDSVFTQVNTNTKDITALRTITNSYPFTTNAATDSFGINTTTPTASLHVSSSATERTVGTITVVVGSDALQIDTVTLRADAVGNLNNKYWYLVSAQNATNYVIWYNVNAAGFNPYPATANALGVATSVEVAVTTGSSAITVAQATQAAINALPDFTVPVTTTSTISITRAANGWASVPVDGNVAGLWATAQTQVGRAGSDVFGTSTTFTTDFQNYDAIAFASQTFTVNKVISANRLVIDSTPTASVTNVSYTKDINLFHLDTSDSRRLLTVTKRGYLGVGTSTPYYNVHSATTSAPQVLLEDTDQADGSSPYAALQTSGGSFRVSTGNRAAGIPSGLTDKLTITNDGHVVHGVANAYATAATTNYMMIPSCAGAPTGTPANIPTGKVALHYDTTANALYVYNGGVWRSVAVL